LWRDDVTGAAATEWLVALRAALAVPAVLRLPLTSKPQIFPVTPFHDSPALHPAVQREFPTVRAAADIAPLPLTSAGDVAAMSPVWRPALRRLLLRHGDTAATAPACVFALCRLLVAGAGGSLLRELPAVRLLTTHTPAVAVWVAAVAPGRADRSGGGAWGIAPLHLWAWEPDTLLAAVDAALELSRVPPPQAPVRDRDGGEARRREALWAGLGVAATIVEAGVVAQTRLRSPVMADALARGAGKLREAVASGQGTIPPLLEMEVEAVCKRAAA